LCAQLPHEREPTVALVLRGGCADEVEDGDRSPKLLIHSLCEPMELLQGGRPRAVACEAAARRVELYLDFIEEVARKRHGTLDAARRCLRGD
jgi:hypothetical protein